MNHLGIAPNHFNFVNALHLSTLNNGGQIQRCSNPNPAQPSNPIQIQPLEKLSNPNPGVQIQIHKSGCCDLESSNPNPAIFKSKSSTLKKLKSKSTISKKFKSNPNPNQWIWQKSLNPDLNPNPDWICPPLTLN